LFRREAVRFLKENRARPFFLYVPFNAPHTASNLDTRIRSAAQAPERYKQMYPTLKTGYTMREVKGRQAEIPNADTRRLRYLAAVTCMDEAIGELLGLLDEFGLSEDTIVIFLSDNGGGSGSDNGALRGGKGRLFEGGIRVPCLLRWPRRIKPGSVSDAFLTSVEVFPSVLAATGIPVPEDVVLDGFDMMPVLADLKESPRKEMFWQRRGNKAARVGRWKWVESQKGGGLFDLFADIHEKHDLSKERPAVLERLRGRFAAWRETMHNCEPRGPFRDY
jgi:arylsulfatase A-like enzyme